MSHRVPADIGADLLTPTILAGELSAEHANSLRDAPNVVLPGAGLRRRSASHLIDLATLRLRTGDVDDLTELEPLYVHQHNDAGTTATGQTPIQQQTGTGTRA
jgi:hypothetical protein